MPNPAKEPASPVKCFDVEITQRCGIGCPYCYLGTPGKGDMSQETADDVLRLLEQQAEALFGTRMELNLYGGEPFLNFPIVQYLVERARAATGATCTIFTNGATATPEQVQWCRDREVFPKRSTAGCPEAATLTRPGDYTARWLAEGKLWKDFADTHRLTVTPATARYVAHSVRWLGDNGYHGPVDLAADEYADWPYDAADEYEWNLSQLAWRVVAEHFAALPGPIIENFCNFARSMYEQADFTVIGCGAGTNTVGITFDGRITYCHRALRDEAMMSLSDLLAGKPLVFSPFVTAEIDRWRTGNERSECEDCPAWQPCSRGCLHLCSQTGSMSPPIRCRFTRLYVRLAKTITGQLGQGWWRN